MVSAIYCQCSNHQTKAHFLISHSRLLFCWFFWFSANGLNLLSLSLLRPGTLSMRCPSSSSSPSSPSSPSPSPPSPGSSAASMYSRPGTPLLTTALSSSNTSRTLSFGGRDGEQHRRLSLFTSFPQVPRFRLPLDNSILHRLPTPCHCWQCRWVVFLKVSETIEY